MVTLTLTEKGGEPKQLTFEKDEVLVGRVQGNDVVLPKGNVSKRHCRIVLQNGTFSVEDMKSTNGTYVNGRKIAEPTVVNGNDKIYVGDFVIRLEGADAEESAAGPEAGSLGAAIPRRPPPPPPPGRTTGQMRAPEEDQSGAKPRSSPRITMPPPPPPPRRETGGRTTMPPFGDDDPLAPPSPADIDIDDEPLATQPPRLNVPPLKPVFSAGDDGDDIDNDAASTGLVEKDDDKEEPITAQRGGAALRSTASAAAAAPPLTTPRDVPPWLNRLLGENETVHFTGTHTVELERRGRRDPLSVAPSDLATLPEVLRSLAARGTPRPAPDAGVVFTTLPDGSRLTAFFPPIASELQAAIQRPASAARSLDDLSSDGVLSKEMQQVLEASIASRRNILVAGDRAATTTLLQALAATIPAHQRVVAIADRVAVPAGAGSWLKLAAEPRNPDLIPAAVSLRPDYLLVDVTTATIASDILHECALGQEGAVVAIGARSAPDALARLQALAGPALGASTSLRELASFGFDLVVHVSTVGDGTVKLIELAEPKVENGQVTTEPLLVWKSDGGSDMRAGRFQTTNASSRLGALLAARGQQVPTTILRR